MDDGALSVLIPGMPMMQLSFAGNWDFPQVGPLITFGSHACHMHAYIPPPATSACKFTSI